MKRFLSLVLCVCLTICSMILPVAAEEAAKYDVPEKVSGLLTAIGVIRPGENIEEITLVSRGQFAAYAARLLGETFAGEAEQYYTDVPEGSFCFKEVSTLVKLGALSVPEDKMFNPNNAVTYSEACKILMCVLGFGDYAEVTGGYPKGYVAAANRTDINAGLSGDEMNIANTLQMLYNACHTEIMDIKWISNEYVHRAQNGDTILSASRNIYMTEGRIEKNGAVSLIDNDPAKKNMVQISGMLLHKGETKVEEILGHYVDVYYQKTKAEPYGTVVYYYDRTDATIIEAENAEYKPGVLTYYEEKSDDAKLETLNIGTDVPILLNGKRVRHEIQAAFDDTKNGHIEVVYYNNEVSLVHIRRKETIVIKSTYENQQSVWDEYRNKYFIFDEEKYERLNVYKGQKVGGKISFEHLQQGQVLSIYKSLDGKIADVYMSESTITGTTNQIKDGEVSIDGVFYKINKEMEPYINLDIGIHASFYLDVDGEVCRMEPVIDENIFAYIYDVGSDRSPFDPTIKLKVFTTVGDHKVIDVKLPVYIDGESKQTSDDVLNALSASGDMDTYRQLVGLKFNSKGELKNIDTAADSKAVAEEAGSLVTQVKYNGQGTQYYIPSNNPSFRPGPLLFKGTNVLVVPEETHSSIDEDLFTATDKSYFNKVKEYKISSYKTDFSHPFADFIVVRAEYAATIYGTDLPIMVDEVYQKLDKNGKPVKVIKGIQQGLLYEGECRDNVVFWNLTTGGGHNGYYTNISSVDDLRRGDLIRTGTGIDGRIGVVQIMHDFEPNQKPYWFGKGFYLNERPGELSEMKNTGFSLTAGYVIDLYYDKYRKYDWVDKPPVVLDIGYNDASTVDRTFLLAHESATVYDVEKNRVYSGLTYEDITTYNSGYGGSYMITASVSYNSRGVYVYVYPGGE